jgi:hypothetical protein
MSMPPSDGVGLARVCRSAIHPDGDLMATPGIDGDLLLEPWDRRLCNGATEVDLDLIVLREALRRMRLFSAEQGLEPFLSPDHSLSPFVPPLLAAEPLTGVLRPRNFAVLLFGRNPQRFIPGAVAVFSIYPGGDRSDPISERHDLAGNLVEQALKLQQLLDVQSYTAFDKTDPDAPNAIKYPKRALYETLGNALAHRDYEAFDPTRLTVFADRIEVASPGSLPTGVDLGALRAGAAPPKWRNQALAWFFSRLQLAQAEGQGIPTILRSMREEGNPPPTFDADQIRVVVTLPAHPRHAILRDLRAADHALVRGDLERARTQVEAVLGRDPLNFRAVQLFAEVHQARRDPAAAAAWARAHLGGLGGLPSQVLLALGEAIGTEQATEDDRRLAIDLLDRAATGRLQEDTVQRIVRALRRALDDEGAFTLLEGQMLARLEWADNPHLLRLRGDARVGMAQGCRQMAGRPEAAPATRARAWREFHAYLDRAEHDLRAAHLHSVDARLREQVTASIAEVERLRREQQPPAEPGTDGAGTR